MLLEGKKGIILGVANARSIAWGIAQSLTEHGAQICYSYQNERLRPNLEKLLEGQAEKHMFECDVSSSESIENLVKEVEAKFGELDFLVHSLAYADKNDLENKFVNTSKENFLKSLDISAYSLVELSRSFSPILKDGGSIIALTFLGSEKTVVNYNTMGVSKAALEAAVRYLAVDFGKRAIRVNAISAGPIQTLAARGIRDFSLLHKIHPTLAPLGRATTLKDVGGAATFLVSELSSGITSEVMYVDAGFHNVAVGSMEAYNL